MGICHGTNLGVLGCVLMALRLQSERSRARIVDNW